MNDKLKSRKFVVWITSTVLLVLSFIISAIVKSDFMSETCKTLSESWGWISTIYIGGNVAQKCFVKGSETE